MLTFQDQIYWIQRLQENFSFLKPFFIVLNYLDTFAFYAIMIVLVFTFFDKKIGFRFLVLMLVGNYLKEMMKQFYDSPRPYLLSEGLNLVDVRGFGLPSGGAFNSTLIALFFFDYFKKFRLRALFFLFSFLISFSRIYLGVHFFTDVLAGILSALVVFYSYKNLYLANEPHFYPLDSKKVFKRWLLLIWAIPICFVSWFIWDYALLSTFLIGFFYLTNRLRIKF